MLPNGSALAVLDYHKPTPPPFTSFEPGHISGAVMRPTGVFDPPVQLTPAGSVIQRLVTNFAGDAAVVYATEDGTSVVMRPRGSDFGPPRALVDRHDIYDAALDPRGGVTLLGGSGAGQPWVARSDAAGTLGPPEAITTAPSERVWAHALDVAPDGTTTAVLWVGDNNPERVISLTAPPGGDFGPPQTIADDSHAFEAILRLASDARGDLLVAWNGGPDQGSFRFGPVQTRLRPRGGAWGATKRIPGDPLKDAGTNDIRLAMNRSGDAVLAWSAASIAASYRPDGGDWEVATALPDDDNRTRPAVGVGANGAATVIYTAGTEPARIEAIDHPAGRTFQSPEPLADPVTYANDALLGVDPHGRATAIWAGSEAGHARAAMSAHVISPLPPPGDPRPSLSDFAYQAPGGAEVHAASTKRPRFRFRVSERGRAELQFLRVEKGRRMLVATVKTKLKRGPNRVLLPRKVRHALKSNARYDVRVVAVDRHEQYSKARRIRLPRL